MDEIKLVDASLVESCQCSFIVKEEASEYHELGKEMIKFCFANGAAGLSGPQIGVFKKLFVFRTAEDSFQIVMNPKFINTSKRFVKVLESCLTYGKKGYLVSRCKEIQAVFNVWDNGKFLRKGRSLSGLKAIMFCHETLHVGNGDETTGATIKQYGVPQVGQEE